jgi:hypothetical protein
VKWNVRNVRQLVYILWVTEVRVRVRAGRTGYPVKIHRLRHDPDKVKKVRVILAEIQVAMIEAKAVARRSN